MSENARAFALHFVDCHVVSGQRSKDQVILYYHGNWKSSIHSTWRCCELWLLDANFRGIMLPQAAH